MRSQPIHHYVTGLLYTSRGGRRLMRSFHGETTTTIADTEIPMTLGKGVYHFKTIGLHTDGTFAQLGVITLDWEDGQGTAHSDVLWSGFIHAHNDAVIRDTWVVGPGTLKLSVLKEEAVASTAFAFYDYYSQQDYKIRRTRE